MIDSYNLAIDSGVYGGDAITDLEIPRYIRLMKAEKMTLDGFITHKFELEEINRENN